ncbi:DUF1818 family protein [Synechococcus sp. Nb3U1]|uniref:DUF1818 family protein n=1 Tax=Synechococcus sp. Nb3U1 TaxID=1914529 RepID=UPI001F27CA4E|nr:DUF1818 family protein [Synechococcus sp. Nb3U1]MCF2970912.1 DUF1818 family protein [Synechococcus sp. Nb3U1]
MDSSPFNTAAPTPENMARNRLFKGSGWRLGWDPNQQHFVALVGGETWALELTHEEWQAFVKGLQRLQQDMEALGSQLMAEESMSLEQAFPSLTLIASGNATAWSLYLQLHQGRRGEGCWPAAVVPELSQAIAQWPDLELESD